MKSASWGRVVQVILALAVIGLAVRSLLQNWNAVGALPVDWQLRPALLVSSALLIWICYAMLIESWRRMLSALGHAVPFRTAARIWTVASLGKYVPGKVWAIAGAVALARDAGVPAGPAVTAALTLQGLALASGAVVIAATLPSAPDIAAAAGSLRIAMVIALVALGGMALLAWPSAVDWINRRLPQQFARLEPLPVPALVLGFLVNALAWLGYGFALSLLARGVLSGVVLSGLGATAVFTASYLVGLVALFAPGGVGPREGVLVLLLTPGTGARVALALAIASRVLLTITELGAALPFLLFLRERSRVAR